MHTRDCYRRKISYFRKFGDPNYVKGVMHFAIQGKLRKGLSVNGGVPVYYAWGQDKAEATKHFKQMVDDQAFVKLTRVHINGKRYPHIKTMKDFLLTLHMMKWDD